MYDIRELQGQQDDEDRLVSMLVGSLEREKGVLVDDLRWQGGPRNNCFLISRDGLGLHMCWGGNRVRFVLGTRLFRITL